MNRSSLSALALLFGLVGSGIGRTAEACGAWALINEDSKAELHFAAHTVTLYEKGVARKVGWIERQSGRWLARRAFEDFGWSRLPGNAPLLMTLTSTGVSLPNGVQAKIDESGLALGQARFELETRPIGGERHAVVLRRGAVTRYSGRGRAVCGSQETSERDQLADIRARAILGVLWFELREQLERNATAFATSKLLRERSMAFERCWGRSLQSDGPSGSIKIQVKMRLRPDRRVTEVELEGPHSTRTVLSRCLRAELQRWRFPPAVASQVQFPLILHVAAN